MTRIPLFPEVGFTPEQRKVYDKITAGPRGTVVGPLRAALHSPELADLWQSLGEFLRYRTSLPPRLSELAILACGRHWNSDVEWYIHAHVGAQAGVAQDVIDAIRACQPPVLIREDEAVVYEYTRQLLSFGVVDPDAYGAARQMLGDIPLVELTGLIGYYTMVAMTLNAHQVPLPPGEVEAYRMLPPSRTGAPGPARLSPARKREQVVEG